MRFFRPVPAGVLLLSLAVGLAHSADPKPAVSISEMEDRLRVELNGELFTEYLFKGEERYFPVFYPVLGPGQVPMTRSYPFEIEEGVDQDHPHHQSLWFAHSDINGHTFWAVRAYRDRIPGRTVHQGCKEVVSGEDGGHFIAESAYVAADGTTILTDTRTVRFYPVADSASARVLDIAIDFHASHGDIVFGDEKDAGMAIRVATDLQVEKRTEESKKMIPWNGKLVNSNGVTGVETWGKQANWVDCYGEVSGKPVGVAVMDHPGNPRHPTWWHSRTYGLLTANPFGKHFFENLEDRHAGRMTVPKGETVSFRWRFVFHPGTPEEADIGAEFSKFSAE